MADPLSVTFGALGLAGLFTTVTEIWSFVDAGRGYSEDFSYFRTRLDNQRERFMQWGREMGFGSEAGYEKRLDEPRMRLRIEVTLLHIKLIFSNTSDLVKTYGVNIEEQEGIEVLHSGSLRAVWKTSYERFRTNLRRRQRKLSVIKVTRWSVKDGAKFKNMIDRISELLNDLNDLTKDFVTEKRQEDSALAESKSINDLDQRKGFQREVPCESGYAETVISSTIPDHRSAIDGRYAETITSSAIESRNMSSDVASDIPASLHTTFYTGKSHQERPTIAGTIVGDDNRLEMNGITDQVEGLRECVACMEDFPVQGDQVRRSLTSMCKHDLAICMPCVARSIRSDLENGCNRVRCPECRANLSEDDVRSFADSDTIALYGKKKQHAALDLDKKEPQSYKNIIRPWYEKIEGNCKICPGCELRIEKFQGCDHMICTGCRTEFCWVCLVNYAFINKEGNHRHKTTCRYYIGPSPFICLL